MNYILVKNRLGNPDKVRTFVALKKGTKKIDRKELIRNIASRCSSGTSDIDSILQSLENSLQEYLTRGFTVHLGFLHLSYAIKGLFENESDSFQKGRNYVALKATFAPYFSKEVQLRAKPEKVYRDSPIPHPTMIANVNEDAPGIRTGSLVKLSGLKIGFNKKDPDSGVFIYTQGQKAQRVMEYAQSTSTFVVMKLPDTLIPGENHLEVRVRSLSDEIYTGKLREPFVVIP